VNPVTSSSTPKKTTIAQVVKAMKLELIASKPTTIDTRPRVTKRHQARRKFARWSCSETAAGARLPTEAKGEAKEGAKPEDAAYGRLRDKKPAGAPAERPRGDMDLGKGISAVAAAGHRPRVEAGAELQSGGGEFLHRLLPKGQP